MDRLWTYFLSCLLVGWLLGGCAPRHDGSVSVPNRSKAKHMLDHETVYRQASENAGHFLDSIVQVDSTYARAHWEVFAREVKIGNYVKAFHHMDIAATLEPEYYLGDRGSMRLYYLRDYEGAIADYMKSLEITGINLTNISWGESTLICLGIAHYQNGDYEQCRKWMDKYIELWRAEEKDSAFLDLNAVHFKALSFFKEQRYPEAVEQLELEIARYPRSTMAHYHLGLCYHEMNQREKACQSIRKAAELHQSGYMKRDKYRELFDQVYLEQIIEAQTNFCGGL